MQHNVWVICTKGSYILSSRKSGIKTRIILHTIWGPSLTQTSHNAPSPSDLAPLENLLTPNAWILAPCPVTTAVAFSEDPFGLITRFIVQGRKQMCPLKKTRVPLRLLKCCPLEPLFLNLSCLNPNLKDKKHWQGFLHGSSRKNIFFRVIFEI